MQWHKKNVLVCKDNNTMIKIMQLLLIATLCILLYSCANGSINRIGQNSYPRLNNNENVLLFTADNQIKDKYEVIGIISYNDPGKYQILTLADAIGPLKKMARWIGANAIIIDKSQPVKSGIISTGIYVEARAIRLLSNVE